jgi:ubiquinone/menaquinone biosynthesis C-methylase UbiE
MDPAAYQTVFDLDRDHWFFVGRRRIIARLLESYLPAQEMTILDVGCGTGVTKQMLENYGQVIGLDMAHEALHFCQQRGLGSLCQGHACHLPFADETCHLVTALDVIEHLENDALGLREFHRVLKEGGQLLLSAPAYSFLWSDFDLFSRHYRRYTATQLRRRVEASGFTIRKISYANTILFPFVLTVRTIKKVLKRWVSFRSDLENTPKGMNGLLAGIFSLEAGLIERFGLPFGVSIVCLAEK